MDYLITWLSRLIEPAALVAWVLVVVAFRLRRNYHNRPEYRAVMALLLVYLVVASPLGANILVGFLEHRPESADACAAISEYAPIVVLAGGVTGMVSPASELTTLKESTYRRVIEGVHLASSHPGATLVLSGGGGESLKEAYVMRVLAVALGFPRERITTEDRSTTTFQNGVEVARILRQRKKNEIRLVTSAMHMPRAAAVFRNQGFTVCPMPADEKWVQPMLADVLVPHVSALQKSTDALHEMVGYVWYFAAGRL